MMFYVVDLFIPFWLLPEGFTPPPSAGGICVCMRVLFENTQGRAGGELTYMSVTGRCFWPAAPCDGMTWKSHAGFAQSLERSLPLLMSEGLRVRRQGSKS